MPNPSESPVVKRHERGPFVVCMIALAFILFVAAEVLLYYRWATVTEPTCVLIIDAAEPLKGWDLIVDGFTLAAPYKTTIGAGGRYALPFYVEPGEYTVKIQRDGEMIYREKIPLMPPVRGRRLDLTMLRPSPTTSTALPL